MTTEDQALDACLNARDATYKAMRLLKACRVFCPKAYEAIVRAEDAATVAINVQLELRQRRAA